MPNVPASSGLVVNDIPCTFPDQKEDAPLMLRFLLCSEQFCGQWSAGDHQKYPCKMMDNNKAQIGADHDRCHDLSAKAAERF
jgi:hypothetical protein